MLAYLYYSILLSGWVYPIIVRAIWSRRGFLSALASNPFLDVGVIDFAGSGVVHLTGGTTALFAAAILGPRRGRFTDETGRSLEVPKAFPGSSFALQVRVYLIALLTVVCKRYSYV
jgi:Amt family ammonium transporter